MKRQTVDLRVSLHHSSPVCVWHLQEASRLDEESVEMRLVAAERGPLLYDIREQGVKNQE